MLNDVKRHDVIHQNKKQQIVHHKLNIQNNDEMKESKENNKDDIDSVDFNEEFQIEWTVDELKQFNRKVFKIIESRYLVQL